MAAPDLHTDMLTILLTQKQSTSYSWYVPYASTKRIATSNFNTVYAAIDARSGRDLIIKETRPRIEASQQLGDQRLRLASEGAMLRFLAQLGIVAPRYYDYYVAGERAYLVMSRIPGRALDQLRREGELSAQQVVWIVAQLCLPVQRLHRTGYVHHDIKPANVVVRPDGVPVLIDWGAATAIRDPADLRPNGTFTPGFVSADQARGAARPGNDIFALGRMLEELIPWAGPRLRAVIARATASGEAQYRSAAALGSSLLRLAMLDHLRRLV